MGAAFKTALSLAAESGSAQVSAFLPGASDTALSIAVEHGMRITLPMLLMSTRDFGIGRNICHAIRASCDHERRRWPVTNR